MNVTCPSCSTVPGRSPAKVQAGGVQNRTVQVCATVFSVEHALTPQATPPVAAAPATPPPATRPAEPLAAPAPVAPTPAPVAASPPPPAPTQPAPPPEPPRAPVPSACGTDRSKSIHSLQPASRASTAAGCILSLLPLRPPALGEASMAPPAAEQQPRRHADHWPAAPRQFRRCTTCRPSVPLPGDASRTGASGVITGTCSASTCGCACVRSSTASRYSYASCSSRASARWSGPRTAGSESVPDPGSGTKGAAPRPRPYL